MSEIEWYLDELFDQLAGTGAAGRRALMEAENHLRAAAAGDVARGLPGASTGPCRRAGCWQAWRAAGSVWLTWLRSGGTAGRHRTAIALSYGCYTTGMLVTRVTTATTIAAAGAALLLGRWLAVRYAALTSSRRGFVLRSRR